MSRHLISIDDLDRAGIERILDRADSFAEVSGREIKKVPALRGRTVVNLFYESSTRTSSVFELAAKRLSADVVSIRAAGSSVDKGESLKDTVQTLSALRPGRDRDPLAARRRGAAGRRLDRRAVINAGDGKHEHPTQALLDVFTLRRALGALDGAKIWIVGDVLHSRVARSDILAFKRMGAEVTVVRPADADAARDRGARLRRRATTLDGARTRPTSSTSCGCSTSGCARPSCPSLREYAARYQINCAPPATRPAADASRPGQPRRRAVGRRDRLSAGADRRPGQGGRRGADGGALRAAGRRAERWRRWHEHEPATAASTAPAARPSC